MDVTPWWEWLLAPTPELRKRDLDPAQRLHHTGHNRPMSPSWARTIGMWGLREPRDIIAAVGPVTTKTRYRYDVFKGRYGLWSSKSTMHELMDQSDAIVFAEIGPVMIATYAHSRIVQHRERSPLSVGAAATVAVESFVDADTNELVGGKKGRLGILPIEAVLYYYSIERILEEHTLTLEQWSDGTGLDDWKRRAKLWAYYECEHDVILPDEARERYAVDHEEG